MKKIYNWLVVSSANPEKVSTTIKGLGVTLAPFIVVILVSFFGIPVTADSVISIVADVASIAGLAMTIFGLGRKIYKTLVK